MQIPKSVMFVPSYEWALDDWAVEPVGSRVTCNPPPTDTDEDFLVCCFNGSADSHLKEQGFKQEGSPQFYTGNDDGQFKSFRRGETNVIVTPFLEFFEKFRAATHIAKRLNIMAKSDRIALFQAVLYGVKVENLEEK